ncbi:MAG: hypothetical protein KBC41_01820 [Candidatus Pacebacteria bacterium]|nr:hypothetical protein [Candidatus Paceibacterota bacterium]MBP9866796.1 hypothetical protein [Candidatus Paceibacterota bacterium]
MVKKLLVIVAVLVFFSIVGVLLYLRQAAKQSPSIQGNEYDKNMKKKTEEFLK